MTKCRERANISVWWPGIGCDIQNKVSKCDFCQENLPTQRKEPLITTPLPERAWKKIGADLCKHEGKQFLVVIDFIQKIAFMSSTTSYAVINKFNDILPDGEYQTKLWVTTDHNSPLSSFASLAKSTTSSVLPLALTIHKQMEKQKAESVLPRRY